jgi:hypothetical protein
VIIGNEIYIPVWVAVVSGIPGIIASISHFIIQYRLTTIEKQVSATKKEINGRMTQLLDLTKSSAHAEGILAQKEKENASSTT